MIDRSLADTVITIGPAPDMQGGIAQVLDTYFHDVFDCPKFIPEIVAGHPLRRLATSVYAALRLAWRLATDPQIKIVHLHTATRVSFPRSLIYARIARAFGRQTVMHVHGANFDDYYRAHPRRVSRGLRRASRVVALSESWRRFFEREIGLDNVVVVPNIVSEPSEAPSLHDDGRVHALFLGLIGPRKGIFDLLQVLHEAHDSLRGRFMLHIGGNGDTDGLLRAIHSLGIEDLVEFHGWVRQADKAALLQACSIYILPSYGEGLPISILEAMTYGCAIISTRVGGIPEVVDDTNGALIAPGDRQALRQALLRMVDHPADTAALGRRSIERTAPYRSQAVALRLAHLYRDLAPAATP